MTFWMTHLVNQLMLENSSRQLLYFRKLLDYICWITRNIIISTENVTGLKKGLKVSNADPTLDRTGEEPYLQSSSALSHVLEKTDLVDVWRMTSFS